MKTEGLSKEELSKHMRRMKLMRDKYKDKFKKVQGKKKGSFIAEAIK
jgi:hypothetical protein